MLSTHRYRCFFAALALAAAAESGAQEIVERLPAGVNLVARIRVDDVLASRVMEQLLQEEQSRYGAADTTLDDLFGFRLADLHTIWLVAPDPANSAVLLEGRFDAAHVASRLKQSPVFVDSPDTPILQLSRFTDHSDGREKLAAVIDDSLLCFGDVDTVQQLIDVWSGRSEPRSPEHPALQRLVDSPVHVLGTLLDTPNWSGFEGGVGALFEELWLGGDFTTDFSTTLEIRAAEERAARGLDHLARGLLILAPRNPELAEYPDLIDGLATARVERIDSRFFLTVVATEKDIRHALDHPED